MGGSRHAECGVNSRTTSTCTGSDEEVVEDELVGQAGTCHIDVDCVHSVVQFL